MREIVQSKPLFSVSSVSSVVDPVVVRLLCVCVFVAIAASTLAAPPRPNVVVLLADDLGWKDIGCYGGPVKTPTLDRLAAHGVRFTDFYAGAAVCGPSRAVLLTGRHHARTGIYGNVLFESFQKPHLLEREITLPEAFFPQVMQLISANYVVATN